MFKIFEKIVLDVTRMDISGVSIRHNYSLSWIITLSCTYFDDTFLKNRLIRKEKDNSSHAINSFKENTIHKWNV